MGVFLYYLRCYIHILFYGEYDLIHIHKTDAAPFIPLLERKFKVVATSHAIPYYNDKWSKIGKLYFRGGRANLYAFKKEKLLQFQDRRKNTTENKYQRSVRFIPNGLNISESDPNVDVEKWLKEQDVNENYILFAARRIIPLKGCHTLIQALNQIEFTGTLLIIGDEDQMPSYTQNLKQESKTIKR